MSSILATEKELRVDYSSAGKFALKLALAATLGIALAPATAYAQSAAPIEGVLEWFVGVLQGSIARSFAIIAVCFLGFLAMTGRLAWMMAFSIIIGIALIFGAAQLVDSVRATAGGG
ncbi:MAG: hypothetical protein EOR30_26080 [Mesorhizobium sp.]|nr:MAG: hypothetical protein EOR14_25680 [Mesorhizobium sp.]RWI63274.1 MAG: hypothetical protein EOR17_29360 [Mesorhizobium sp.]RWI82548.1 MAG: hypothetical protein EOR20_27015 [Mesorhizobium sp.]RWJ46725.1 MAG: hypothetical protein EOR30_26080 [Mesorhizobium sp.]RWJ57504.1 MAG: hypothetical protein EOR32_29440 [Mesorhizobium sp.]